MPARPATRMAHRPRVSTIHPTNGRDTIDARLKSAVVTPMATVSPPKYLTKNGNVGSRA